MRTVIELRHPSGSIPIKDIKLNAKSRDAIPALPIGLQAMDHKNTDGGLFLQRIVHDGSI